MAKVGVLIAVISLAVFSFGIWLLIPSKPEFGPDGKNKDGLYPWQTDDPQYQNEDPGGG